METGANPARNTTLHDTKGHVTACTGRFLTFILGSEEYGIAILRVKEIIGIMSITPVPQAPHYLKGIINLRGKVIPVFDLRLIFGMEAAEYNNKTCIIIVDVRGALAGVAVDTVSEVLDVKGDEVDSASQLEGKGRERIILGIAKTKERLRILIDIDKILSDEELAVAKQEEGR